MKPIAIIPARGGSKRIPKKNIRLFAGKPIIEWSIEAALESQIFSSVVVSTDDPAIANVAKACGAQVPFSRPASLSDDFTETGPVIAHALNTLLNKNDPIQFACCIYPTAPFLSVEDLKQAHRLLRENECSYVIPVAEFSYPIQRAVQIDLNGALKMFQPEYFNARSQDLEKAFHDSGQFYFGRTEAWLNQVPLFSSNTIALRIPRFRVQDIDTEEDWSIAESLWKINPNTAVL
jgi:N-acylneuraminate cytidylyltransferase